MARGANMRGGRRGLNKGSTLTLNIKGGARTSSAKGSAKAAAVGKKKP